MSKDAVTVPGIALTLALGLATAPASGQALRVGASLPVIGRPIALTVRATDHPLSAGAAVRFSVIPEGATDAPEWSAEATVVGGQASVQWAPTAPGPYRTEAELDGTALPPVSVFAVTRPLHFSYWACPVTQRYATAVMENGDTAADADRWLDRGILPLEWKPGAIEGHETPEQWANDYVTTRPARAGITIDEFWGAGAPPHRDEPASLGLLMARAGAPELFQAPYCLTVEREIVQRAFAQADLCQVELYRRDFRGYQDFVRALSRFVDAGLGGHTIPILAAGPGNALWITTEAEMRRQIEAIRWAVPDIPGVGFFPDFYPGLAEAADRAILDYYLGPVLWLRDGDLRNIGQMPAKDVRLRLPDSAEQVIELLAPGARLPVADGSKLVPRDGLTIVGPQPAPVADPSPDTVARFAEMARAAGAAPELGLTSLKTEHAESEDSNVDGQVSGATLALAMPITDGPLSFSFDVALSRCYFYGTIGVWLAGTGPSRMGIGLSHNDHDADIPPDSPRPELVAWSEGGVPISETCPLGLSVGVRYRFALAFDGQSTLNVAAFELDGDDLGSLVWAVELPFAGPLIVDRVAMEVKAFEGSAVEVTADGVLLRGVSGGEKPSPYVIEGVVSRLRIGAASFQR